jgi:hypothetical protein
MLHFNAMLRRENLAITLIAEETAPLYWLVANYIGDLRVIG